MRLHFYFASALLYAILFRSVPLATTNTLPWRLCYLDIVNCNSSVSFWLCSWCSSQLQAWFKCIPKVGVAILDSERFHAHIIKELRLSYLPVGHSVPIVGVCLRIIMDRPRIFCPSTSILPGHNMYVVTCGS